MDGAGSELPPVFSRTGPRLRTEYAALLDEVDDELTGAALLVADAMPRICRAVLAADPAVLPEASALSADVRERCRRVEEQGFVLLAREAPVSGDLRRLVAVLRLVHDTERSGRLLRHVADVVERLDVRLLSGPLRQQLEELADRSLEVYRGGVDAWRQRDALAVHELDRLDTDVDTLRVGLIAHARQLRDSASEVMALGLLGRYFERLADHGVAFAQQVTFVVTGERVDVSP
ncbi:MAG: phosphate signaling complex PhoU family protein [Nitriliruptoraceae bacterium]